MTAKLARPIATPSSDDAQLIEISARRDELLKEARAKSRRYSKLADTMPEELRYGCGSPYLRPVDQPPDVRARREAWERDSGLDDLATKSDLLLDEASDIETTILRTPAHTFAGIVAKLRIAADNTHVDISERRPTRPPTIRRGGHSHDR